MGKNISSEIFEEGAGNASPSAPDLRRLLPRLHRLLRDAEGNSSILERFDEISKLLFLKIFSEQSEEHRDLFHSLLVQEKAHADRIRQAYASIARQHSDLFPPKFRKLNLDTQTLCAAVTILSSVELAGVSIEAKSYAYEEMIRNTFDKGDNQQFFTPLEVVEFMVEVTRPFVKGRVCDPACGTGGFLAHVAATGGNAELLGLEIDDRLAWVSGLNLLLHGASTFIVKTLGEGGTLGVSAASYTETCDLILTNPPFGSDFTGPELDSYVLGKGRSSRRRGVLFIERCLQLLKPGGILAMVIDDGVLASSSAEDVRSLVIRSADVLAILSLPDTAFLPYASVSTSILILRRKTGVRELPSSTFFAKAESIGRKPTGDADWVYDATGVRTLNSDLPAIQRAWEQFIQNEEPCSGPNVFQTVIEEEVSAAPRLDFAYQHPARRRAENALRASKHPLVRLKDLVALRNEGMIPASDMPDQVILYTGLAHMDSFTGRMTQVPTPTNSLSSGVRRYERGDLLFAKMRPNLRKVAISKLEEPGYASAECLVMTPKASSGFLPELLAVVLRSDFGFGQIVHHIAGIGRPRVSAKDVLNIQLPQLPLEKQQSLLAQYVAAEERTADLLRESARMAEAAAQTRRLAINQIAECFLRT